MTTKLSVLTNKTEVPKAFPHRKIKNFVKFKQKVQVGFEKKNFAVKTVETKRELAQAMMLRYEVFHKEYMGKKFPIGMDTDFYDSQADLLVIIDKEINRVVGTYRFIASCHSEQFYSASEFHIENLLRLPGTKLELSRACIKKEYRKSNVLAYLWKGLAEYMKAVKADYLFGCSSIQVTDLASAAEVFRFLKDNGHIAENSGVTPLDAYRMPGFQAAVDALPSATDQNLSKFPQIPGLLQSYLKAGAKIYSEPALDKLFNCIDLLTVLDLSLLSEGHHRKFVQNEA